MQANFDKKSIGNKGFLDPKPMIILEISPGWHIHEDLQINNLPS